MSEFARVDMHLHSTHSDGSDTPNELMTLACESGCQYVALTDHDTVSGVAEAQAAATENGLTLLRGLEVSVPRPMGTFHVLIYLRDEGGSEIEQALSSLQEGRARRNRELITEIQSDGIDITWEQVIAKAPGGNVGRPHFAAAMVEAGLASTIQDAFERFLGKGARYYVPKAGLDIDSLLELCHASGAVACVAHPLSLSLGPAELEEFIGELAHKGLRGLECHYSRYSLAERTALAELASSKSLIPTGGSDYHGSFKSGLSIGRGEGDLNVPRSSFEAVLDALV